METLMEIEAAIERLPVEQKHELLRFLLLQLHDPTLKPPEPRDIPIEQIRAWIAEDEADMRAFREGK